MKKKRKEKKGKKDKRNIFDTDLLMPSYSMPSIPCGNCITARKRCNSVNPCGILYPNKGLIR